MYRAANLLAVLLAMPNVALAQDFAVATRAGTAGEIASILARQTQSSILIADPQVARRIVPPLQGRMAPAEAVKRLARAAGGRAVAVAPNAWRIEARIVPARQMRSAARAYPIATAPIDAVGREAIVVIGSKRDLTIGQLPGQVSVLEGSSLEAGGLGGTEKITQRLATVTSTHLGSGRNKLFIRGIADSSFTGPTQATVGQYFGDMRLTYNAPDPDLRLSDMARVEVLEGPQGTLYGAGSLGGIIRLVPNTPVMDEVSGSVTVGGSLTQSGSPGADASATLNLPLTGALALRATMDASRLGGYIDKPLIDRSDVNRSRIRGGRANLRAEIGPDWTIDLIGVGQSTDARDSQYAARYGEALTSNARLREGADADYAMGQFVLSGRFGDVRLRSTTGLVRQHLVERYDASLENDSLRLFVQDNRTRMIANETRVWQPERNGFGWLVGASFTHNRTVLSRRFESEATRSNATGVRNTIEEATLYAEASLRVLPSLTATAGGRVTHSRLSGAGEDVPASIAFARAEVIAARSTTTILPSFALNGQVLPETTLYIRYQEGFRPGGLAIESDFVRRFRADQTASWEFGARHGRPGTGPFDLALSLSFTRWRDIQADFIDNSGLPSTANIGNGQVWSASATAGVELAAGLRLETGASWNRSEIDEPSAQVLELVARALPFSAPAPALFDAVAARSMQVPNIAQFSGRAGLNWDREIGETMKLTGNAWASYVGTSRLGIGPELGERQGDYFDSGADLRIGNEHYGLTLALTNVANVRGNRFSLGTPFGTGREQVTPLRPRTVRLGIDARF